MSENGALSMLYTISFFTCHGFWVGYTMINKVCFVPDRLHIPYRMFKIAASTNQSKQPSLPCEMMKNINYVVFKQMVKSFLIRLQGPVCVYAHCKILVIPGSVGLYNVPHRFNWVVSMTGLDWGFDIDTHTHPCTHTHIYINYNAKVKISAVSFTKNFLDGESLSCFQENFFFHFPSVAFSQFFGLHKIISYIQHFALPGTKNRSSLAGYTMLFFPSMWDLVHLHVPQTMDPATSSPSALPSLPPSPGHSHQSTWKPGRTLPENWERTLKTQTKIESAALLSLTMASWAVADIWVRFPGTVDGKSPEMLCSPPQTGHGCDHHLPKNTCRLQHQPFPS